MLVYPEIDPVALSLGPVKIHWYGLMYLVGFVGCWWLGVKRTERPDLDWTKKQVEDLIFYGAIGVVLGGRIGYTLFYNLEVFLDNPATLFYIWKGGMSFHGGFLGVLVAYYFFARHNKKTFFQVADFLGLPRPATIGWDEANRTLSQGMLSYLRESRRMDNSKLLKMLA